MIPKARRLKSSRVDSVIRKGKKKNLSRYFSIRFLQTSRSENRFCVVVSTRIAPKAVERNRLRRRIYEGIKQADSRNKTSYDIVLIARNEALMLKLEELIREIKTLLTTIHEKK